MRKRIFSLVFLAISVAALGWPQEIRKPVWAGAFYDGNKDALSARIDAYLKNVKEQAALTQDVKALICPHAGYVYSGPTAAYAFRLVQGKPYDTVIIIGTSHQHGFDGCSVYPRGGFETPLGVAEIDEALASQIAKASGFSYVPQAHAEEHSVEVQVPFIQKTLPDSKIVPIVMGYPSRRTVYALANALAEVLDFAAKKILIVASTDMSHYLSKAEANAVDSRTISLIQKLNTGAVIDKVGAGENIMCGGGGVAAAILAVKKKGKPRVEVLHYTDSSEASGDSEHVVGYLAAAITVEPTKTPPPEFSLSAEEKKELLGLAKQSVESYVREGRVPEYETENRDFLDEKGAFVTLKKHGELRGCIGFIEPLFALYEAVIRTSVYAATEDARFSPVTKEELKDLEYEISVLTPLQKIDNPRAVRVGKHGLVISMGENRGLLLPQVPVENNWDRETFLDQACVKAGLPPDAWKKGAEIFVFEAIVFHEK
jgi:AmmeMemoRadiSam system protein B/AmmeMemoRadiSam system protein A